MRRRVGGRISIHSTRVGGDDAQTIVRGALYQFQSTPPVWAETDLSCIAVYFQAGFQSTPPVWAETHLALEEKGSNQYFNPLHPCGRRPSSSSCSVCTTGDFNPLHPCGRRQQKKPFFRLLSISITTYFTEKSKRTRCKFSHLGYLFQYSLLILVRTSLYVDV